MNHMQVQNFGLAPIALFVYKRPEHTRMTVEALRANYLAQQSDLFVFSDGAKDAAGAAAVAEVRKLIRSIDGFKSVTITEREQNLGLSKSVVEGVTQLCVQYGRAIVVEDDVLTAPDFLAFLNCSLDRYAGQPKVFSVGGFNLPIPKPSTYPYDAFFSYRFMCWGWGTWRDRWEQTDWSVKDYPEFAADRQRQKRFDRGGNDCSWLLARQMSGKIDSWDTIFNYAHFKHDAVASLPVVSKAYNIGFDGSGTHCRRASYTQSALREENHSEYRFPHFLEPDPYLSDEFRRLCDRSMAKRVAQYVRDNLIPQRKAAARAAFAPNIPLSGTSENHGPAPY